MNPSWHFLLSFILIALVLFINRLKGFGLGKEILIASLRASVQLIILSSVILIIFSYKGSSLTLLALGIMIVAAAHTSKKRAMGLKRSFWISLVAIALGSLSILFLMVFMGLLKMNARILLPLGGMVIGNAMVINSLALERLRAEIKGNVVTIDAALALGATPKIAVAELIKRSIRASLIPRLDSLTTLGLVWIPGLMAGMILGGSDPLLAAQYQIIIMFMILSAATITVTISTEFISREFFTSSYQLKEEFR
ncbi:hypothetical protein BMS3Bbin15_01726 [archaeon BMS3Bbin15]|nr:hypothetical protein BMS3Bbin15_01726 [archaeon BMS3Bbin15]